QGAFALDEVEQMGHLLEVRWDVRVIPPEVCVVELDVDHMLDVATGRVELAAARRGWPDGERLRGCARPDEHERRQQQRHSAHAPEKISPAPSDHGSFSLLGLIPFNKPRIRLLKFARSPWRASSRLPKFLLKGMGPRSSPKTILSCEQ